MSVNNIFAKNNASITKFLSLRGIVVQPIVLEFKYGELTKKSTLSLAALAYPKSLTFSFDQLPL